jgi:hypothetical protein
MRSWIHFGVIVVCVTLAVSVGVAWHMARLDAVGCRSRCVPLFLPTTCFQQRSPASLQLGDRDWRPPAPVGIKSIA